MKLFRISKTQYINDLTGTGARLGGGRWNSKGTALLYVAQSVSLAILEVVVHTGSIIPDDLSLLELEVPDDIKFEDLEIKNLPLNWIDYPAPIILQNIGDKWVLENKTLLLRVPSVPVRGQGQEYNMLINPNHPDMNMIRKLSISPFSLDSRLLKNKA